MSSMAEGSEGWAREDELDLGLMDEGPQPTDQGTRETLDHLTPSPQEHIEEELDSIDHVHDQASEKTVEAADSSLPQTPPPRRPDLTANPSSVEETVSTPDDTPSLHVSYHL